MCTYCEQHCVEDELWRLSLKEIKSGKKLPENTCPDKQDDDEYDEYESDIDNYINEQEWK